MKSFRLRNGKNVEVEREIKTLKLINVENTDYYKGKNHDEFLFKDSDNHYIYNAALNADMTEYDTKFATELIIGGENKFYKISGYFVPTEENTYYIYNPRLLNIEGEQ